MRSSNSTNRDGAVGRPPRWARQLLIWLHPAQTLEEVEGDLDELYTYWYRRKGKSQATFRYVLNVISVLPPFVRQRPETTTYPRETHRTTGFLQPAMLRNYLKIAIRNLTRNKVYSFINIGGLSVGLAVAMLIGLWLYDELSFNRHFQQYDRLAQVMQQETTQDQVNMGRHLPIPLWSQLRTSYPDDFKHVVISSWTGDHILGYKDRKFTNKGNYLSADAPDMLTLTMLKGTRAGLKEPASILLSESVAQTLFGETDPMGKIISLDNKVNVTVTGVYEDLPYNTDFRDMSFIAPWDLLASTDGWVKSGATDWQQYAWQVLVELAPGTNFEAVSAKIKTIKHRHSPDAKGSKTAVFLYPMADWHLYSEWDKQGNPTGRIQFVWLFGIIGLFVLFLACINFMNLSTARSEKRAKEVGIRKAVGSVRSQLIGQFLSESFLVVALAFVLALLLVQIGLPWFNELADKQMAILWDNPLFWALGLGFSLLTGLVAGSYPAFYLSGFQPVKVLKGTIRVGRFATVPRKVLVVVQFTVSVTLIIGTFIVFRQIQYAKNRPIGYDRTGLITIPIHIPDIRNQYNTLRSELLTSQAIVDMATSSAPTTELGYLDSGYNWEGKDPTTKVSLGVAAVTHDFGRTVGWQFVAGRDFSRQFSTDSAGMILNQTAVDYMGLKNRNGGPPIGKTVTWNGRSFQVVGVINDVVMESPFTPVKPTVFILNYRWATVFTLKLNPERSTTESLSKLEAIFHQFDPNSPFEYKFSDQQYALKFATEERIGGLASAFAVLAIFISCLGLFGLASFVAEQRTKEIGVRKVLGASVFSLWGLLSKDFLTLVIISFLIASPTAYYVLHKWLATYDYRTGMPWWIFALSGAGALAITLLTVSYQSIKAALLDPVKSLRSE